MSRGRANKITPIPQYLTRSPSGVEQGYIRLTPSLTSSDAFKSLTPLAVVVYLEMLIIAKGHDKVIYTQKMAYDSRQISKSGYTASVKLLERVGFLHRLPRACYAPSTYQFDARWKTFSQTD